MRALRRIGKGSMPAGDANLKTQSHRDGYQVGRNGLRDREGSSDDSNTSRLRVSYPLKRGKAQQDGEGMPVGSPYFMASSFFWAMVASLVPGWFLTTFLKSTSALVLSLISRKAWACLRSALGTLLPLGYFLTTS